MVDNNNFKEPYVWRTTLYEIMNRDVIVHLLGKLKVFVVHEVFDTTSIRGEGWQEKRDTNLLSMDFGTGLILNVIQKVESLDSIQNYVRLVENEVIDVRVNFLVLDGRLVVVLVVIYVINDYPH